MTFVLAWWKGVEDKQILSFWQIQKNAVLNRELWQIVSDGDQFACYFVFLCVVFRSCFFLVFLMFHHSFALVFRFLEKYTVRTGRRGWKLDIMSYKEGLYNKNLLYKRILGLSKRRISGSFKRKWMPLKYNVGPFYVYTLQHNSFFSMLSSCILDCLVVLSCASHFTASSDAPDSRTFCSNAFTPQDLLHSLSNSSSVSQWNFPIFPVPPFLSLLWKPSVLLSFFQYSLPM